MALVRSGTGELKNCQHLSNVGGASDRGDPRGGGSVDETTSLLCTAMGAFVCNASLLGHVVTAADHGNLTNLTVQSFIQPFASDSREHDKLAVVKKQ